MTTSSTQPARGTRDFLPDELRRREYVVGVVRDVYQRYGFEPIETPAFENISTLLGKYGEEGNKLIFKILRRGEHEASGEADLALRYDLTVPLARVVAQYQSELPRFFKRYQIQPVWRADRPARGRFREFYQCDIDAVGSASPVIEAELLSAVSETLSRLGFADFVIRINHREALTGLLETAGIPAALHGDALVAVDKMDKLGVEGVERELSARGIGGTQAKACLTAFGAFNREDADVAGALRALRGLLASHDVGTKAVDALDEITSLADATPARGRVRLDPSLARGLSYYTGAIMEIAVPDLSGSLGGGGRYDGLVGMFLGRDIPACGFSLGLERIIVVMHERGMFPPQVSQGAVDAVVTFLDDSLRTSALGLAIALRHDGLRVDVFPESSRKIDKSLKFASARRSPVLVIIGPDEQARGEVAVRDLVNRRQDSVPMDSAVRAVAATVRAVEHRGP